MTNQLTDGDGASLGPTMSGMSRYETRSSGRSEAEARTRQLEAQALAEDLPEGFASDNSEQFEKPTLLTRTPSEVWTLLNVAHWAIWGVLARLGLIALTEYPGSYLGGVVWANFAACFVMGWAVESSTLWLGLLDDTTRGNAHYSAKGSIPVYTGITTGFCGTCSSFSSFILETFNKSANTLPQTYGYPNAAYGIMDAFAVVLAQICISVGGFHFGKHLLRSLDPRMPRISFPVYRKIEVVISALGIAAYIVVIVLLAVKSNSTWRSWMFLCLFSPWAAIARYIASKKLNPLVKNFPMGTFFVNTVGSLLLAIFTILQRGRSSALSDIPLVHSKEGCRILVGLDNGFCGTFTTVSTFVAELFALNAVYDYKYGFATVFVGYSLMVLIVGSYNWKVGLVAGTCR